VSVAVPGNIELAIAVGNGRRGLRPNPFVNNFTVWKNSALLANATWLATRPDDLKSCTAAPN